MSTYRIKTGHGVALASLVAFDPQPRCYGLEYTREMSMPDGSVVVEGPFFMLRWSMNESDVQYRAILTACGLVAARTAQVTVYGPDDLYNWVRYNATAVRPLVGRDVTRDQFFIQNVAILFKDLVAL
jgi:hypothetical protein